MSFYRPITKVVQSVYIPAAISYVGTYASNYWYQKDSQQGTKHQKAEKSLNIKAVQVLVSSPITDYLCEPFKSNFILHGACSVAVKDGISYGVQGLYNNVNHMFASKNELDNQDLTFSLEDDSNGHPIQEITSFLQA